MPMEINEMFRNWEDLIIVQMKFSFTNVRPSLPMTIVFIFLLFDMFTGGSSCLMFFGLQSTLVSLSKKWKIFLRIKSPVRFRNLVKHIVMD
jgi:hypothetical protein